MFTNLSLISLNSHISYIPDTNNPLSSNVVIVEGEEALWVYDVGRHIGVPELLEQINSNNKKVNVILSHFHGDHTDNLKNIRYDSLLLGKETFRHTGEGAVVTEDIFVQDGLVKLHFFVVPSSHAKGCIAMEVDESYCFLGDSVYPGYTGKTKKGVYNVGLLKEQINVLKKVEADKFFLSHSTPFERPKQVIMRMLESVYAKRQKGEPYIKRED